MRTNNRFKYQIVYDNKQYKMLLLLYLSVIIANINF